MFNFVAACLAMVMWPLLTTETIRYQKQNILIHVPPKNNLHSMACEDAGCFFLLLALSYGCLSKPNTIIVCFVIDKCCCAILIQ